MAKLNTNLSITVPEQINVTLVRADYLETTNVYRLACEAFLSVGSCLIGVVLCSNEVTNILLLFLIVAWAAAIVFGGLSIRESNKARGGNGERQPAVDASVHELGGKTR